MDFLPLQINQVHTNHDWSMTIDSTNIRVKFGFEGLKTGIVPFLRLFGRELRFGTFNQQFFLSRYQHHLVGYLKQLMMLDGNADWDEQKTLAFYLYMVRVSTKEPWHYPALISRTPSGGLDQPTGMSRAFANLITKAEPWKDYPVLLTEALFCNKDMWEHCDIVTTDRQLHEVLDRDYNQTSPFKPKTNIDFHIKNRHNTPYLKLDYIGNGTYHDHIPPEAQILLKKYMEWRSTFSRPTIKVHAAMPHQVINTDNFWQVESVPLDADLAILAKERSGYLETAVRDFHQNRRSSMTTDYAIWLMSPGKFDLATLVPWMTLDHNVFHDRNYSFLLYRPESEFKSTEISVHTHTV